MSYVKKQEDEDTILMSNYLIKCKMASNISQYTKKPTMGVKFQTEEVWDKELCYESSTDALGRLFLCTDSTASE